MRYFPGRLTVLGAAVLAVGFVLFASASRGADHAFALTNCNVADLTIDAEERAFLTLINNYRAQNGAPPLTISTNLNRGASWMAVDLGTKNYFSHTDSLGRSPSQRAVDCGSPQGVGENLAAGTVKDTAQEAFDMWRASSGHDQNMRNASYRQIGIARYYAPGSTYGWYWVTKFSLVHDGTNALLDTSPTPTPTRTPTRTPTLPTATPTRTPATSTPAPTATPPSTSVSKAVITSPTPGTRLTFSSWGTVTFRWSAGSGAREYRLDVGSTPGGREYYSRSTGLYQSASVSGLPRSGSRTIYVRLWTRFADGWQYNDYTYLSP